MTYSVRDLPRGYLARAAEIGGINRSTVTRRAAEGWPLHALHLPPKVVRVPGKPGRGRAESPVEGPTDPLEIAFLAAEWGLEETVADRARVLGFTSGAIWNRRNKGLDEDEIWDAGRRPSVSLKRPGNRSREVRAAGIPRDVYNARVYQHGWSHERAISTPVTRRKKAA